MQLNPIAVANNVRVVHAIPGRVRLRFRNLDEAQRGRVETKLRKTAGVVRMVVSEATGTTLLHFDPTVTDVARLLQTVHGSLSTRTRARKRVARASAATSVEPRPRRSVKRTTRPARATRSADVRRAARRVKAVSAVSRLAKLLQILPAILGLISALLSASSPLGYALAGIEAIKLASDIGTTLYAA